MERTIEQIDLELTELIADSKRRKCTPRVCRELGMDALLDERNALMFQLELDNLSDELPA